MRLIAPSFEIMPQGYGLEDIYKQIELAGRTCYKSEDRITQDSAKRFVEMIIKNGHGAMLEHGTVYLKIDPAKISASVLFEIINLTHNSYSVCREVEPYLYITTNVRVLVENRGWWMTKYLCSPTQYHEKRITVRFTCDIGISREFNRHRVNSMAEQSTRYCNYTTAKHGGELSIILPPELKQDDVDLHLDEWAGGDQTRTFKYMCGQIYQDMVEDHFFEALDTWLFANLACEWSYNRLIRLGWKPQQARRVLPLDLQTELVHTAFVSDWQHFFDLRCAKDAHPQARELAIPLKEEFIKQGYI